MNARPGKATQHPEDGVEAELPGGDDVEGRQREKRLAAKGRAADDVRDHRRKHNGAEGIDCEVLKDELEREEDARNGRVERCRDTGGRPAGDEQTQPILGDVQHLSDRGAQRRADLHDRAFASHRPACADADRRGERLDDSDLRSDLPAPLSNGEHDLGHAMAPSFRSEELDQGAVDEAPDNRREDDEVDAEPRHVGIDRMSGGAVVVVTGEEQREPADEVTKDDRPESAARADHQRNRDDPALGAPNPVERSSVKIRRNVDSASG